MSKAENSNEQSGVKRKRLYAIIAVVCVLVVALAVYLAFFRSFVWKEIVNLETAHFEITFVGVSREIIDRAEEQFENAYNIVSEWGNLPGKIEVYVCKDYEDFSEAVSGEKGRGTPPSMDGVVFPNKMILRVSSPMGIEGTFLLDSTVVHELTHVLMLDILDEEKYSKVAYWHMEGFPEYVANQTYGYPKSDIAAMVANEGVRPITNPMAADYEVRHAALTYVHAYLIEECGGPSKMKTFLQEIRNHIVFEDAFRSIYGMNFCELETEWMNWLVDTE